MNAETKEILEKMQKIEIEIQCSRDRILAMEAAETKEKWMPRGGDYLVSADGSVSSGIDIIDGEVDFGMRFTGHDAAVRAAVSYRTYHRIYCLALDLNEGWEANFSDPKQKKFFICSGISGELVYMYDMTEELFLQVYFRDEEAVSNAIEIINAEV